MAKRFNHGPADPVRRLAELYNDNRLIAQRLRMAGMRGREIDEALYDKVFRSVFGRTSAVTAYLDVMVTHGARFGGRRHV